MTHSVAPQITQADARELRALIHTSRAGAAQLQPSVNPLSMHPTEAQFIQVAQRYAVVGMQAAKAYNEEQAKLGLEIVLSQFRLENSQGTKLSLATLERLSALTSAHRDAFKKVVLAFSAELSAVMAEMPDHLCDDYRSRIAAIVQWQLSAQSEFYTNRERWIAAATEICELIESHRESVTFSEQGVHFAGESDLDRFMRLMGVIEESHQIEVARLQERLNRLAQSATTLGFRFVP